MKKEIRKITSHISRIEGQLASIKRELGTEAPDCKKAALTLRAASRSMSSLRCHFVECYLADAEKARDGTYKGALLSLINA